ncbi:MAG: alpha/beta hydrolase [Candidatus Competibacteraceae bacterium]
MIAHVHRQRFDIQAGGHRLHAERLIPPSAAAGPTLVFLHEGLGSIGQWRNFPATVCARIGLPGLVYERWGFGRSAPLNGARPKDYMHQEACDSLPEVLEASSITEPPILFGHSDGGSIALLFAAAYPDRARAVISEAAHVFIEEITLAGIRTARSVYEQGGLQHQLRRHHGDNTDMMFRGWCDTWLRPDFRDWNIETELRSITCPLLIIQGEDDEYGTRAQVDTIAASVSGPTEILWLPDCAHIPHHQAREPVLVALTNFIGRICASI